MHALALAHDRACGNKSKCCDCECRWSADVCYETEGKTNLNPKHVSDVQHMLAFLRRLILNLVDLDSASIFVCCWLRREVETNRVYQQL